MRNMKKEDLLHALNTNTGLSKKETEKVINAVIEERERLFTNSAIEVKTSPIHGRGVFATKDIPANSILEECHFVQLKETNFDNIDPALQDYVFEIQKTSDHPSTIYAIALGISSIINHSHDGVNATWVINKSRRIFVFTARRRIRSGEEILIDYNGG